MHCVRKVSSVHVIGDNEAVVVSGCAIHNSAWPTNDIFPWLGSSATAENDERGIQADPAPHCFSHLNDDTVSSYRSVPTYMPGAIRPMVTVSLFRPGVL